MGDVDPGLGVAIEGALEAASGHRVRLTGDPVPLTGGFSAELYAISLADPIEPLGGELVLRIPRHGAGLRREAIVQREAARCGYPAPAVSVIVDDPENPLGRPFLVMAKAPGRPLFVDAGPIEILKAFRSVPAVLAQLMAKLHDVDPVPVASALEAGGVTADRLGERFLLDELDRAVEATGAPELRSVAGWLVANRPELQPRVVCHGDLHALNILDDAGRYTVVDWELATIGHPALDVARSSLLLSAAPIEMPRPVRVVVQRLGQRSAARFRAAYCALHPLDADALSWHEALHAGSLLGRLLRESREAPDGCAPDPWTPTVPYLAARVRRLTGIDVAPAMKVRG